MEPPRRLHVRCSNNSRNKEFDICVSETVSTLNLIEYITKVELVRGDYVFKGCHITHYKHITVQYGDTMEILGYREMQGRLHEVKLKFLDEVMSEKRMSVPEELTFRLLKFMVQSKFLIDTKNQIYRHNQQIWRVPDSYMIKIPEDFGNLLLEDISQHKNDYCQFYSQYGPDCHNGK